MQAHPLEKNRLTSTRNGKKWYNERGDPESEEEERQMEWNPTWEDPLTSYVKHFDRLIGDQRTRKTFGEIVKCIIGASSLICRPDCEPVGGVKQRQERVATRDPVGDRREYEALGVGCRASD
jgi:hypothetical protein